MGKKSLKLYKKKQNKIKKQNSQITKIGNDLIKKYRYNYDEALLYCLDNNIDVKIFDYIYGIQLKEEAIFMTKHKKYVKKLEEIVADVSVDMEIYCEQRNLPLLYNFNPINLQDFVLYIMKN
tara:strand:- start:204 stop:569 length:366 start_codon:yes stop_codon:yes gene_type:complete